MKKSLILILCLILASIGVFSQQTIAVECPDYSQSFNACQQAGGTGVSSIDSNGCTFLQECKMPSGSTTVTPTIHCGDGKCESGEHEVNCSSDCGVMICPDVQKDKSDCEKTGWTAHIENPVNGCPYVRCEGTSTTACISLEQQKKDCENSNGYLIDGTDRSNNCEYVRCRWNSPNTPSMDCSWMNQDKERCKLSGGTPREEKMDQYNYGSSCPMIVCDYPAVKSFANKKDCENNTGCFCEYRMCDNVPTGKSYESFCGKNFKQGYYCMIEKPGNGIIECGGSSGSYCPMDYYCDYSQGSNKGTCVKNNQEYSCPEEMPEELDRRSKECEKVNGKLVKQQNNWGSSSCAYSMCVSQNLKCGNVPSSVGMLMCPEGYYCEHSMTPYPSSNYNFQEPEGKCIKLPDGSVVKTCPELDSVVKEKCYSNGGTPTIKKENNGCEVYSCEQKSDFCGGIAGIPCPAGYMCELDGNYPDASGKCYPVQCPVMEEQNIKLQKQKCLTVYNGKFEVKTDAKGCVYTECGLKNTLKTKPVPRPLPPEDKKDRDLGKLFNVAFKLEEVRMQFDSLKRKTSSIADYHEQQGDASYAEKFKTVSNLLDNAINEVDTVKADLRDKIDKDQINEETFRIIKQSLSNVKNNMKDVLKELLR